MKFRLYNYPSFNLGSQSDAEAVRVMFFIFRNTLHATRQRFPKEQKGFEAYNGSHMSNIPALIRCAISYVRLTELSPYVSFNSPSFHRIKDGAPRA